MWLLMLVLLSPVPGFERAYLLDEYVRYEACQIERNRIGFEMAAAYPYDRDFVIECRVGHRQGQET